MELQKFTDKELGERITSNLMQIPDELASFEALTSKLTADLRQARRDLEDAETAVIINTPPQGANEAARKAALLAAQSKDPAIREAKKRVSELENSIGAQEVDSKRLSRLWTSSLALAEFQAARLNLLAKINSQPKGN